MLHNRIFLENEILTAAETAETGLSVTPSNFADNLGYMGKGMAGIMAVMLVIIAITALLNKAFKGNKE